MGVLNDGQPPQSQRARSLRLRVLGGLAAQVAAICATAYLPGPAAAAPVGAFNGVLTGIDRDTLAPVGPFLNVAEPHAAGQFSPDGTEFAMGLSADGGQGRRIGLWIVRADSLEVRHAIRPGIATSDVAFPGVVAGLLQNGELVVIDPASGRIEQRHRLRSVQECGNRRPFQQQGWAAFPILRPGEQVRLAVVSAKGKVRVVSLPKLRYRVPTTMCGEVGLTGDMQGNVYVVAGHGEIAKVDLKTRAVRYLPNRVWRGCPSGRTCTPRFQAAWVRGVGLAIAGEHRVSGSGRATRALGLFIVSARTGSARLIDPAAKTVHISGSTVVVSGSGVRGYTRAGKRRFSIPTGDALFPPQVADHRMYLPEVDQVRIIDLQAGRLIGSTPRWSSAGWLIDSP